MFCKCVICGDNSESKSQIAEFYKNDTPEGSECYKGYCLTKGYPLLGINVFDTTDRATDERLVPDMYPFTNVFVVVYAIDDPESLETAENVWVKEIKIACPGTPYILVGTDKEQREENEDPEIQIVTKKEGEAVAKRIEAEKYIEVAYDDTEGIEEVYKEVLIAFYKRLPGFEEKSSSCCNLI